MFHTLLEVAKRQRVAWSCAVLVAASCRCTGTRRSYL